MVHYNINSITTPGKLEQLTDYCRALKIDVLILTESKLDKTIPTDLITIQGYHEPVRRDRDINGRFGGGVLIYIADYLVFQHKENLQSQHFEHVWVDVRISSNIYSINALYRPPNESHADHDLFLESAENILVTLRK